MKKKISTFASLAKGGRPAEPGEVADVYEVRWSGTASADEWETPSGHSVWLPRGFASAIVRAIAWWQGWRKRRERNGLG